MLKTSIAVFLLITVAFGVAEEERKPGHCLVYGQNIKEGDDFFPAPVGYCEKIQCTDASTDAHIALTCPAFKVRPGCHKTKKDLTKPFPNCCPKSVCDDN